MLSWFMLLKEAGWNMSGNVSVKYSGSYLYHHVDLEDVDENKNFSHHGCWNCAYDAPEGGLQGGEGAHAQPNQYAQILEGKKLNNK